MADLEHQRTTKELQPTGRLEFQVRTWIDQPIRKLWLETNRHPLDAMLPEIVATFMVLGQALVERSRKRQEEARAWAERQRQLELARQRKQQDDNRWKRFLEIAGQWKQAELARGIHCPAQAARSGPKSDRWTQPG